jgi:hypothetical protein
MVNYNNIFLQRTGQATLDNPFNDTQITQYLDSAAYKVSRTYATPWSDFESVPDVYQYAVVLSAALDYWWMKAGESAGKYDMSIGGGQAQQRVSSQFDRCMQMIAALTKDLESMGLIVEGNGDIVIGDLVIRDKDTGYLVPRENDPRGDWTS